MVKSWFNVQHQVVTELVTSLGIMLPIVVFQAVQEPTNQKAGPKMAQIRNLSGEHFLYVTKLSISMTTLLTHTVAHSTKPSFWPKTNNQPHKNFSSLALS